MSQCTYDINYGLQTDGCKTKGGIAKAYFATWTGGTANTFLEDANEQITGGTGVFASSWVFYEYDQYAEKATLNINSDVSDDRLAGGYNAESTMWFKKNEYLLRQVLEDAVNTKMLVVLKDNEDNYVLLGTEYGAYASTESDWGTALNDPNGVTVTISSKSTYSPKFIDATYFETLIDDTTVLTA